MIFLRAIFFFQFKKEGVAIFLKKLFDITINILFYTYMIQGRRTKLGTYICSAHPNFLFVKCPKSADLSRY